MHTKFLNAILKNLKEVSSKKENPEQSMPCFLYIFEFDHKNVKIDIDLELHIHIICYIILNYLLYIAKIWVYNMYYYILIILHTCCYLSKAIGPDSDCQL